MAAAARKKNENVADDVDVDSSSSSSTAIKIGRRVALKDILRVLKSLESLLRSRSVKGVGSLPTIDEQRPYNLILGSCRFLHPIHFQDQVSFFVLVSVVVIFEEEKEEGEASINTDLELMLHMGRSRTEAGGYDARTFFVFGRMDGPYTQEQYLEDIVSYLRAFKLLLSAEVLTLEEMNTYYKLWSMPGADFLWCTRDRSIDPSGVEGTDRKKKTLC